jgi:hypothetical protein
MGELNSTPFDWSAQVKALKEPTLEKIARFGARATPRTSLSAHSNCVGNRRNLFGVQDSSFGRFDGELWS